MLLPTSPGESLPPPDDVHLRPRGFRPRRVLAGAGLFVLVAVGLYAASPWLLPLRIVEGPLVQAAGPNDLRLVWYFSRPAAAELLIEEPTGQRVLVLPHAQWRQAPRVEGLLPGCEYPYAIRVGERILKTATFQTNRAVHAPFRFVVFGDSGKGTVEQYRLGERIAAARPDFVVHTGDLVYDRGERSKYRERFFVPYAETLARVPFWPSLGNHDVSKTGECSAYREVFELPENGPPAEPAEHNYWFDYADARFVILDSNITLERLRDHVAPWVSAALADPAPRWRFVVFHHPPYTGGKYVPDVRIQQALVATFESERVDLVFSGHDHNYQRTYPLRGAKVVEPGQGVVYVVSGAGGASLYQPKEGTSPPPYLAALQTQTHSFTLIEVDAAGLRLAQWALDGQRIDEWHLAKPLPAP